MDRGNNWDFNKHSLKQFVTYRTRIRSAERGSYPTGSDLSDQVMHHDASDKTKHENIEGRLNGTVSRCM